MYNSRSRATDSSPVSSDERRTGSVPSVGRSTKQIILIRLKKTGYESVVQIYCRYYEKCSYCSRASLLVTLCNE